MIYLIKIPLKILQKTGIILSFILSSMGPLFHPKNQAFLSRILFMLVSKLVTSFTRKDVFTKFHKIFTKGIGGQIREDWTSDDETTTLDIIRIADFINKVVATRRFNQQKKRPYYLPRFLPKSFLFFKPIVSRLPQTEGPELQPAVIMKLDVEGNVSRMAPQYINQEFHVKWLLFYQIAAAS